LTINAKWAVARGKPPLPYARQTRTAPIVAITKARHIPSGGTIVANKLIWLAMAGSVGTLARFGLSNLVFRLCGAGFPWGTVTVNTLGCVLFGFVWALADERHWLARDQRDIVLVGFMGAFTTFSTFANDTVAQLRHEQYLLAFANLAVSNILGIAAICAGLALARTL